MTSPGSPSHRLFRAHLTRGAIVAVSISAVTAVLVLIVLVMFAARGPSPAPAPPSSSVTTLPSDARVTLGAGSRVTVPNSSLGISTEYWTIPVWARQMGQLDRVLAMLSQDGPIRLRIGGDSADRVQWAPTQELPE